MQVFKKNLEHKDILLFDTLPTEIIYKGNAPAKMVYPNGDKHKSTCIGCQNPFCIYFDESEIECKELSDFSSDKNLNVCPVDAIEWDIINGIPKINSNLCFNCGLCIRRCPVGALYYDGAVKVVREISPYQKQVEVSKNNIEKQEQQILHLKSLIRRGNFIIESDQLLSEIYNKLEIMPSNYHNTVVRNILIGLKASSAMSRIGDVYTRMDVVYSTKNSDFGVVEVEFGSDTLDALRAILDDIAVLNARYDISKEFNKAIVVCLKLPNERQGYWQVVKDIRNVENIEISTMSVGALLILLWSNKKLEPNNFSYYADYDNMEIREILNKQLDRNNKIQRKHLGILEPIK